MKSGDGVMKKDVLVTDIVTSYDEPLLLLYLGPLGKAITIL